MPLVEPGAYPMNSLRQRISHFLHEDPLLRRLLKNTGYMFSSSTLSIAFVAIQSILSARLLGTGGLGLVSTVMTFVVLVNTVFSFRMGDFVVRYFSKAKAEGNLEQANAVIKGSAIAESITSVIAFLFLLLVSHTASTLLSKIYAPVYTQSLIRLFGLIILANLATETANGVLRVTNHYKTQAAINLIQTILTFSMITLAFIFHWGINEVLLAYLIGKVFVGLSPIVMAGRTMRREFGRDWWKSRLSTLPPFKEMARFAISTNFSATIKQFASESEPLWLTLFFNEGAAGLYKVALAIVNLLTIPITPFIQTAFPEITNSVVSKKWDQLRSLLRKITLLAAVWTIPAGLFMMVFGKWIIALFYKSIFLPAYPSLVVLIIGFGVSNILFWNRSLLLSFGKANVSLYVLAICGALKIGLAFVLLPQLGIEGEAALLSGFLIITSVTMVIIGYRLIERGKIQEVQTEAA